MSDNKYLKNFLVIFILLNNININSEDNSKDNTKKESYIFIGEIISKLENLNFETYKEYVLSLENNSDFKNNLTNEQQERIINDITLLKNNFIEKNIDFSNQDFKDKRNQLINDLNNIKNLNSANYLDKELNGYWSWSDFRKIPGLLKNFEKNKAQNDKLENDIQKEQDKFNKNITEKTKLFNDNSDAETTKFNTNSSTKTTEFNSNADNQTKSFNDNSNTKTTEFNTNVSDKTTEFNTNVTNKITEFNSNASTETTKFNTNVSDKTTEFNNHVTDEKEKLIKASNLFLNYIETLKNKAKAESAIITKGLDDVIEYNNLLNKIKTIIGFDENGKAIEGFGLLNKFSKFEEKLENIIKLNPALNPALVEQIKIDHETIEGLKSKTSDLENIINGKDNNNSVMNRLNYLEGEIYSSVRDNNGNKVSNINLINQELTYIKNNISKKYYNKVSVDEKINTINTKLETQKSEIENNINQRLENQKANISKEYYNKSEVDEKIQKLNTTNTDPKIVNDIAKLSKENESLKDKILYISAISGTALVFTAAYLLTYVKKIKKEINKQVKDIRKKQNQKVLKTA